MGDPIPPHVLAAAQNVGQVLQKAVQENDPQTKNYRALQEAQRELKTEAGKDGQNLDLLRLSALASQTNTALKDYTKGIAKRGGPNEGAVEAAMDAANAAAVLARDANRVAKGELGKDTDPKGREAVKKAGRATCRSH